MSKKVSFDNEFMDIVLLSFMGDNSSVVRKARQYQKTIEMDEFADDTELLVRKQLLSERIAVTKKIRTVMAMNFKKKLRLRKIAEPSADEKEMINILDNANYVRWIMTIMDFMQLTVRHNDSDGVRYGAKLVKQYLEKLYGYQSENLVQYLRRELRSFENIEVDKD